MQLSDDDSCVVAGAAVSFRRADGSPGRPMVFMAVGPTADAALTTLYGDVDKYSGGVEYDIHDADNFTVDAADLRKAVTA